MTEHPTAFAAGKIGDVNINIGVTVEDNLSPALVILDLKAVPDGPASQEMLSGTRGLDTLLQTIMGPSMSKRPRDGGKWSFSWTAENRLLFHQWLQAVISMGISQEGIQKLAVEMDKTPANSATAAAFRVKEGFGAVPPGSLLTIPNVEKCDNATWDRLADMPGIFCLHPVNGRPMPVSGSWAKNMYMVNHRHPSPLFISAIHVEKVAAVISGIAAQRPTIRQEMGLDYPIYGPEYYPIPGLNPETRTNYHLWPFQAEMVSKFIVRRRMITLLGVGSGKTLAALACAETLLKMGRIDRVVVVVSRAIMMQWAGMIKSYYGRDVSVIDGSPADRKKQYIKTANSNVRYVITKYDSWRMPDAQSHLSQFLGPRTLVIMDEVQRIKHVETKRWKSINKLLDGVRLTAQGEVQYPTLVTDYRLLMTGSLVHDKPLDVFGPIQMLSLHIWNTEEEFQRLYFERELIRTNKQDFRTGEAMEKMRVVKMNPAAIPDLQEVVSAIGFSKRPEEIGIQLPPLRHDVAKIEPTSNELLAYKVIKGELERLVKAVEQAAYGGYPVPQLNKLQENLLATISMERLFSADPALVALSTSDSAKELHQKIGLGNLLALSPGAKMQTLIAYLGDFVESSSWGKVIVFTTFERLFTVMEAMFKNPPRTLDADEVQDLRQIQISSVFYSGNLSQLQRAQVIDRFKRDPRIRIMFATDAASEGLNLQDAAQFVIHYDQPLSLGTIEQREGRVYRAGQKMPVIITRLLYAPQAELQTALATMALNISKSGFIDPRLRSLLLGKASEKDALMSGL